MWTRLALGFLLAVGAYFVVQYFSKDGFEGFKGLEGFLNWNVKQEVQAQGPLLQEPVPEGDLIVSSGGPNPPNASYSPSMPATVSSSPEASDPYDETSESSTASETLRSPERSFGPGIVPEQSAIAVSAGVAGPVASSPQAFQHFGPEMVTNGGNFFGTVSATEDENPNYSSF